jgi:hypothetical protein
MAAKPYRPKMTAAEKKAYKERNFGAAGKTGGMGGKYGRKSENLSAKQLKAAGAAKAAKKRTVDISQTRREGAVTLGPGGKPLTGTVKLSNGKTAVYKGGKRVQAGPAAGMKSKKPAASSGTRATRTTTRVTPQARGENAGTTRTPTTAATANLSPSALKNLGRARGQAARGNQMAKNQAGTISKTGRPMSTPSYTTKKNQTSSSTTSSSTSSTNPPKNPKIGDTWTAKYPNGRTYTRRYTAAGWRVI